MRFFFAYPLVLLIASPCGWSQSTSALEPKIEAAYPDLAALYQHLHRNPELSLQEAKTSAKLQAELSVRGFEVTGSVGGHGFVAVLKNGPGRTLLIRTDLDALPLKENIQVPYVSREIDPLESAVITVGRLEAGTKRNIIPDTALLQLTVRSYSDGTRKRLLDSIKRIAVNTARAAGVPEENLPIITTKDAYTPAVYNDPDLTERLVKVWRTALGQETVVLRDPEMIGEDFGRYGRTKEGIPISMFRIGAAGTTPDGIRVQSLHSPEFAPVLEPTLKGAVLALTLAALDLLQPPSSP